MSGKYGKFLTVLLIIVIFIVVVLIGFFGFDFIKNLAIEGDAQDAVAEFESQTNKGNDKVKNEVENTVVPETPNLATPEVENKVTTPSGNSGGGNNTNNSIKMYKGFPMVGTIKIPATKIEYPILAEVSPKAIEVAVAVLDGPGLNKVGNTTIVGHNYRNGLFFSNNSKLKEGDKIYVTDNAGNKVEYTIYRKYTTTDSDGSYMRRDTEGRREISLSTCTNDVKSRLVIWAKAD